jgi:hypothetical protein
VIRRTHIVLRFGAMNTDGLDPSLSLTKKSSKVPYIVAGVLLVAGIAGYAFLEVKKRDDRKLHVAFMERFQGLEKEEVSKFWQCILGPNSEINKFQDNLSLSQHITSQFGTDPKNYPTKVRDDCAPKALDAKKRVEAFATEAPSDYQEELKKYALGLQQLAAAFSAWAEIAPSHVQEMEIGKKVGSFGGAWHGFAGGKPTNDVLAFDAFLRCAIPTLDGMKDGQAVVEFLFKQCKDQAYITRVQNECGPKLLLDPPPPAAKTFNKTLGKLAADDRDLSALDDCLRKGRKGKRRDDFAEVGKAWVGFMEAGRAVLKIGRDHLKTE